MPEASSRPRRKAFSRLPVGPAYVKLTTDGILVDWWIGL